jgi:hypothetical protein
MPHNIGNSWEDSFSVCLDPLAWVLFLMLILLTVEDFSVINLFLYTIWMTLGKNTLNSYHYN